jgi:hypothetical protein
VGFFTAGFVVLVDVAGFFLDAGVTFVLVAVLFVVFVAFVVFVVFVADALREGLVVVVAVASSGAVVASSARSRLV